MTSGRVHLRFAFSPGCLSVWVVKFDTFWPDFLKLHAFYLFTFFFSLLSFLFHSNFFLFSPVILLKFCLHTPRVCRFVTFCQTPFLSSPSSCLSFLLLNFLHSFPFSIRHLCFEKKINFLILSHHFAFLRNFSFWFLAIEKSTKQS